MNKLILLLRKAVYPYEDKDSWEKFDENALPPKEAFYSTLNLEDISDEDYAHAQKGWDTFEIKKCIPSLNIMTYMFKVIHYCLQMCLKTLEICLEIYELDPIYFVSAPGLAWQACLKKTEVKLELATAHDMIIKIEKEIRGGICEATHRYAKAHNKYMKNYNKNNESSYI